jgi:WD40 repeat protein
MRENPYVGLDYFDEDEADLFFGRDAERRTIIGNLRTSRFTLLYAASGVGKSSLLRAGVAARLKELAQRSTAERGTPRYVPVVFNTWRDDPLARLIDAIEAAARPFLGNGSGLELPRDRLDVAIEQVAAALEARPLVILDQFEDYFLYHREDAAGERFADELARCLGRADLRANFLVSVREDAYSQIGDRFQSRIPNVYGNYLHLDYLDEKSARAAIRQPVERWQDDTGGYSIEEELVDEVLRDVRRRRDSASELGRATDGDRGPGDRERFETAYLQLVMERLWMRETSEGSHVLRLQTLEELGGAERITQKHLDDAMDELPADEREAAAAGFRFLVTSAGAKIALTTAELSEFCGIDESVLQPALEHLEAKRILRPIAPPAPSDGTPVSQGSRYELFHDVLGRAVLDWRRRHDEERQREALRREAEREEQRKLSEAAKVHEEQRHKLVRRAAIGLGCLTFLLALAVAWAVYERGEARQEREEARSRSLAATADSQLQTDPERSILLAREAWYVHETPEAEAALRRAIGASRVRERIEVGDGVTRTMASPDGRTIATVANPGRVRFWSVRDGRELDASMSLGWPVDDIAFSPDGRSAVVVGQKGALLQPLGVAGRPRRLGRRRVVYAADYSSDGRYVVTGDDAGAAIFSASAEGGSPRRPIRTLPGGPDQDVEFNPRDSGSLAVATFDDVHLWSWRERERTALRRAGESGVQPVEGVNLFGFALGFSPDGRYLATAVRGRDVRLSEFSPVAGPGPRVWDARTGEFVSELTTPGARGVNDMGWSPDSRRIAVATGQEAHVFEAASGRFGLALRGHADLVWTADFSADGSVVATSSRDGTARLWDPRSGRPVADLRGHKGEILSGEVAGRGGRFMTAAADGTVRIWDVGTGSELGTHRDWVLDAAFSPDGRFAATASEDGSVRVWSLADRRSWGVETRGFDKATDLSFDAGSERILVAGRSTGYAYAVVLVADAASGEIRRRVKPGLLGGNVAFSPDGHRVLVAPELGHVPELWDVAHPRSIGPLNGPGLPSKILQAGFSPDGRLIATGGTDGVAQVFDAGTRKQRDAFPGHNGVVVGAAFAPGGRRVASWGFDGTARVWELYGRELAVLRGHDGWVTSADFSPDGRLVVTGGADQTVRVWDSKTGEPLGTLRHHSAIVNSVAFSPDGRSILTAGGDATAKIIRCETCLPIDELLALADRRLTRDLTEVERRDFVHPN